MPDRVLLIPLPGTMRIAVMPYDNRDPYCFDKIMTAKEMYDLASRIMTAAQETTINEERPVNQR